MAVQKPPPPRAASPAPSKIPAAPIQSHRSSARLPPPRADPPRLVLNSNDLPSPSQWEASIDSLQIDFLSAADCQQTARTYVSVATQYESDWRGTLHSKHGLPPFRLHWVGAILLLSNEGSHWRIGTHMMRSASELGYEPSTVSLARIVMGMPPRAAEHTIFRDALKRLEDIVQKGTNPDALTVRGLMYAKDGNTKKALTAFQQATAAWDRENPGHEQYQQVHTTNNGEEEAEFRLPQPRRPKWEWEARCMLGQGAILLQEDKVDEAKKLFEVAALELDHPEAFEMLAKLEGEVDTPRRRTYLLKAAVSGQVEACRLLGDLEKTASTRPDISKSQRRDHELLSQEWHRLAEGETITDQDLSGW